MSAKNPEEFAWPGYNDRQDPAALAIHLHIGNIAQPAAVADIDHFFALELCKAVPHPFHPPLVDITPYAAKGVDIPSPLLTSPFLYDMISKDILPERSRFI